MSSLPIIGITTWSIGARAGAYPRSWGVGQRYLLAVVEAGGVPQPVPLIAGDTEALRRIYDGLDGILLAGGADIDPATYGAERSPLCGRAEHDRDRTDLALARWALEERKPVLGICRGMQLINVAAGGTLHQDISAEVPGAIKHDYPDADGANPRDQLAHDVELSPLSRVAAALGERCVRVNSTHHQGVAQLAPSLVAIAHAPDGVIEGVESGGDAFVLGVQWHPEELTGHDPRMRRIFTALVDAAVAWRAQRRGGRQLS